LIYAITPEELETALQGHLDIAHGRRMKAKSSATALLLVLLLAATAPLATPFTQPGHQIAHDREVPYMRVSALQRALAQLQLPPRWFPEFDGGYGSPYPSFYAMAFYYPAALFNSLGLSLGAAVELTAYLALLASGVAMFVFVNKLWNGTAGLLAAVLYMYAPYHLMDAYVRGAYSELAAFVWFPLLGLGLLRICQGQGRRRTVLGGMCVAGLILSHNLMAMVFIPSALAVAFAAIAASSGAAKQCFTRFRELASAAGVGLLISAFFWLPIAWESRYVRLDYFLQFDFRGDFVGIRDLLGTRGEPAFTTEAGILLLVLSGVSVVLAFLTPTMRNRRIWQAALVVAGLGSLFLTTRFSVWAWTAVPVLEYVQFPWRFLAPAAFYLSASAGSLAGLLKRREIAWAASLAGSALAIGLYSPLAHLSSTKPIESLSSYPVCQEVWGTQDYRPIWSQAPFWRSTTPPEATGSAPVLEPCPAEEVRTLSGSDVRLNALDRSGSHWEFEYSAAGQATLAVPQFYYPGWSARIDGKPSQVTYDTPSGMLSIPVPGGNHKVELDFRETPVRRLANALSIMGVGLAIALLARRGSPPKRPAAAPGRRS
jgi:hypothetical protein